MKIQLGWLKDHVDVRVEAQKLADDLTSVGLAVDGIEGTGDAAVLDLDITTNRVDAMNVRGVAREVYLSQGGLVVDGDRVSYDVDRSGTSFFTVQAGLTWFF